MGVSKRRPKQQSRAAYPRFRSEVPKNLFRVPLSLSKDMEDWLDELRKTMHQSGGYKLPRSYILRGLITAAMTGLATLW